MAAVLNGEGLKVCTQCGVSQPYSAFGPNEKKPKGYFAKCHSCRIANGSGKSHRWNGKGAGVDAEAAAPVPLEAPAHCQHHRLCGSAAILAEFPDFFESHQVAGDGEEWQVCRKCSDAKLVRIYDTLHSMGVEPLYISHLVSERSTSIPPAERALPKPRAPRQDVGKEAMPTASKPVDEGEIARIATELRALDPEAGDAAVDAEAREWGDWDVIIDAAGDEAHPRHRRALQLAGQAVGLPAMEDEYEVYRAGNVEVNGPPQEKVLADFSRFVDPMRVHPLVKDGAPTTPLVSSEAPAPGEDPVIQDLHLRLAEQEELIQELRGQLVILKGRARRVIEEDQALWKAQIAAKDAAIATLVARLRKAERLLAYAYGAARDIQASAQQMAETLEGYEH